MNDNFATDPFATKEMECTRVLAGTEGRGEASRSEREIDLATDPLATNPLPKAAAPVVRPLESNNDQVARRGW